MARDRRYKTFTYKKAICQHGSETLQHRLTSALQKKKKQAGMRCQSLDSEGKNLRGVEEIIVQNSMLFGTIVEFNPGSHQPTVGSNLKAPNLKIALVAPPKRREFLDKYLFFGVKDDHIVIVQSTIRSKQFQDYLNWLLQSATPDSKRYYPTQLVDLPPLNVREVKVENVKSIQLRPGRPRRIARAPQNGRAPTETINSNEQKNLVVPVIQSLTTHNTEENRSVRNASNFIRDIIRRFAPDKQSLLESASFAEALEAGRVRATVLLEVNGSVKTEPVPFMDEFAASVSHADEEDLDFLIAINGGPDITPETLKLREDILVTCDEGMPLVAEVRSTMSEWLYRAIENERVY